MTIIRAKEGGSDEQSIIRLIRIGNLQEDFNETS